MKKTLSLKNKLSSSDLCVIVPCNNNVNVEECDRNACHGKYSYKCSENKCSVNKITCNEYNRIASAMSLAPKISEYKYEMNKFISFNAAILKCAVKEYIWKESHICFNQIKCSYITSAKINGNNSLTVIKKRLCPCKNSHSYSCGNYCSISKKACALFTFQFGNDKKKFSRNIC